MRVSVEMYLRQWQRYARRWVVDSRVQSLLQGIGYCLAGFFGAAASLAHFPQPLVMGLVLPLTGWSSVLVAAGGMGGYLVFWGSAGGQGILWMILSLGVSVLLTGRRMQRDTPLLLPALGGAIVAVTGLLFQFLSKNTAPVPVYLLQIGLGMGSAGLFSMALQRREPVADWLICALGVLALAQVSITSWVNFGCIAAACIALYAPFPAAALAGLALDLAGITEVSMTAVLCATYLTRLIPMENRWMRCGAAPVCYLAMMLLTENMDLTPLPGLLLGSPIAMLLPGQTELPRRRGDTGVAQVRLEMSSAVLRQTGNLLEDIPEIPIDEEALVQRAAERACGSCPCKKNCSDKPPRLPAELLHKPLGGGTSLPTKCRKSGRLQQELRRSQEQLRAIRADRDRRQEYRAAVVQQYRFLSDYLQELSDSLAARGQETRQSYKPQVAAGYASREDINGDRCLWFAGTGNKYYVLLCDGMGTGAEAARDAKLAAGMLRKLLSAGMGASFALRSINSLCALRGQAGAVTVDLAELELDTGKVSLYKWGAAPSYLLVRGEAIKIGTAAPPPGISVTENRETVERLSLRRGETLVMLSDGARGEEFMHRAWEAASCSPGELADRILSGSGADGTDDATVAVVRLNTVSVAVS